MKNFKNISFIATFTFALILSSCAGITDANYSESAEPLTIEAQDMQDQGSDIREGAGEEMEMIRIRPD